MITIPGITEITDDTECKRILMDHGRLEAFQNHPEMRRLFVFWTAGDAFILAAQYRGFQNPTDNGFMVWICDMQIVPQETIVALVKIVTAKGRDWTQPGIPWEFHHWNNNAS